MLSDRRQKKRKKTKKKQNKKQNKKKHYLKRRWFLILTFILILTRTPPTYNLFLRF